MFSKISFAANLRELLKHHQMSQRQLAMHIHVTPQAMTQFVNAQNLPSIETMIAIADVFDISMDDLVCRLWPKV